MNVFFNKNLLNNLLVNVKLILLQLKKYDKNIY